jgi:hypothetical protein
MKSRKKGISFSLSLALTPSSGPNSNLIRTGKNGPLKVNPDQTPIFGPGSRRIDYLIRFCLGGSQLYATYLGGDESSQD